jgi:hypothetical protein
MSKDETTMQVTTAPGAYVVTETGRGDIRLYVVGKDKTCTCGGKAEQRCPHIEAVAAYLRAGGKQAPEATQKAPVSSSSLIPSTCPICGSAVRVEDATGACPLWRCQADSSHYWQWRGERNGVREFLTNRFHPSKLGLSHRQTLGEQDEFLVGARARLAAYYVSIQQTPEERERFLADARERLAAYYASATSSSRDWVGTYVDV